VERKGAVVEQQGGGVGIVCQCGEEMGDSQGRERRGESILGRFTNKPSAIISRLRVNPIPSITI
jgi:hypothetical protein